MFRRFLARTSHCHSLCRQKSTAVDLVEELNRIKTKDLMKIFDEEQIEQFRQLKRSLGGKFHSLDQFQRESTLDIDCKYSTIGKFFEYLSLLKTRSDAQRQRIHVEPQLTSKAAADIGTVCSLDYTASHLNWALVKTTESKGRFQVRQWNSVEVDQGRKFNFIQSFDQLSTSLSTIPLKEADVLLVEESTYRYQNVRLAAYISQLQQIRAVLNTLLHCRRLADRPVYHISGRDVGLHFGLFVGNEQTSGEFFLTNLIFNNAASKQRISVDVDHQLIVDYQKTSQGQREPMALCLLRAFAFLQFADEKKDSARSSK